MHCKKEKESNGKERQGSKKTGALSGGGDIVIGEGAWCDSFGNRADPLLGVTISSTIAGWEQEAGSETGGRTLVPVFTS